MVLLSYVVCPSGLLIAFCAHMREMKITGEVCDDVKNLDITACNVLLFSVCHLTLQTMSSHVISYIVHI